jgi:hypothetical protein
MPSTSPTCPMVISVTSRWKPTRPTALDPDLPRSSSITSTREACQPKATARSTSPYCSRVDSPWSSTCWRVDWRTYTTASRSRCRSPTLLPSRSHGSTAVMAALLHRPAPRRRRPSGPRPAAAPPPPGWPAPPATPPPPGRLACGSSAQHSLTAHCGARVFPRRPRPALLATRAGSQPHDLDQPQQPITSEYRRLPHLVSIQRCILLSRLRTASSRPRPWSAWTSTRSAAGRAIRRHWALVCCAFSFCWQAFLAEQPAQPAAPNAQAAPAAATAA